MAGLKYIETYCFGLFKVFYQETMKEACPVPFYIQEFLKSEQSRKNQRSYELGTESQNEDDSIDAEEEVQEK